MVEHSISVTPLESNVHNLSERLSLSSLTAYASPAIPIAAMGLPMVVYMPPYYAQDMGLGLTVVGLVFMLARVWDVITDPLLGIMSDRFPTRWGRRRHWIVISAPIMILATWQIFMPDPAQVSAWYLLLWMLVLYAAWTLIQVSHMAWGAELSTDYHERSRVQGTREMTLLVGAILVLALPSVIERIQLEQIGTARVAAMGWLVIVLLPVTVFWAVSMVGEKKVAAVSHVSWLDTFNALKQNAPLRRLLLCDLLLGVSNGITAAMFLFLAADVLRIQAWSSSVLLLYFISGIFFVPLFISISKKFGKHLTLSLCAGIKVVSMNVIWFIPSGSVLATGLAMILLGINMGAPSFLLRSMMADVVDEDMVNTGHLRTGLFYSLLSMTEKIGGALAIGLTYTALDVMGFIPGGDNSERVILSFEILFIVPPMLLNLLIAMIISNFPIDKARQEHNRKLIDDRLSGNSLP